MAGQIDIYGFIGEEWGGVTLKQVADQLNAYKDETEIVVNISSGGGYVNEGKAIYNLLKNSGKTVTVNIIGQAYSIASVIAMAGTKIYIAEFADMMIHQASVQWVGGNADQLEQIAEDLRAMSEEIFSIYLTRPGATDNETKLKEYFDAETVIKAQECIDLGLVDGFMEAATATNVRQLPLYKAVAVWDKPKSNSTEMNHITNDQAKGLFEELKGWFTKTFKNNAEPTPEPAPAAAPDAAPSATVNAAELDAAKARVAELEASNATLSAELDTAKAKIAEQEANATEFKNKLDELESKIVGGENNPANLAGKNGNVFNTITAAGEMAKIQNRINNQNKK